MRALRGPQNDACGFRAQRNAGECHTGLIYTKRRDRASQIGSMGLSSATVRLNTARDRLPDMHALVEVLSKYHARNHSVCRKETCIVQKPFEGFHGARIYVPCDGPVRKVPMECADTAKASVVINTLRQRAYMKILSHARGSASGITIVALAAFNVAWVSRAILSMRRASCAWHCLNWAGHAV